MRTYRVQIWFKILSETDRQWAISRGGRAHNPSAYQHLLYHACTYGDWNDPLTYEAISAPTTGAAIEAAMLLTMMVHPEIECFFRATTLRVFTKRRAKKKEVHPEYWTLTDYRFDSSIQRQSTKKDRVEDRKRNGFDTWNERAAPGFGLISGRLSREG